MVTHWQRPNAPLRRSAGFTYAGLLFAVVILGLTLAAAGTVWSVADRRDKEARLLWTGEQYRRAIAEYYLTGPAGIRALPQSLDDLLADQRGPILRRHLRRLYPDPMTGQADWELERMADGGISGVRSAATGTPLKQAGFGADRKDFEGAGCYCDWAFLFHPPLRGQAVPNGSG